MRLWLQLVIAMVLAALGPLVVTGYRAFQLSSEQAIEQSEERLQRVAAGSSAELKRWIRGQTDFLSGWMTLFPDLAERNSEQQIGFLRAVYKSMPDIVSVALIDAEGELWSDLDGVEVPPQFLTQEMVERSAERARGRTAGTSNGVVLSLEKRTPIRPGAADLGPVYFVEGSTRATVTAAGARSDRIAVVAELSMAEMQRQVNAVAGPQVVAVLNKRGEVLAGGESDTMKPGLLKALLGTETSFSYLLDNGEMVRGIVTPVQGTGWSVVVVEPGGLAEALSVSIRSQLQVAIFVSLLIVFVAGILLARPLSRPIHDLRTAALEVADGKVGRQVSLMGASEIVELGEAFNHMSARLLQNNEEIQAQHAEIEAFNRELQQRVADRTRALEEAQKELIRAGQLAAVAEVGAGLAHELNNPLAGILGLTQLLKVRMAGQSETTLLTSVEKEALRCKEVVEMMLRLSSPSDEGQVQSIDLRGLLQEVVGIVQSALDQRGVELRLENSSNSVVADIDPVIAMRIFSQILQSIAAGLQQGDRLSVSLKVSEQDVAVVFLPSVPVAQGSTRDDWMASGMALWVARKMLDQINGRLESPGEESKAWTAWLPKEVG